MQICRDRPSASLGYAIAAPLSVSGPDGVRHPVDRWSLRGFVLTAWAGRPPEDGLQVTIHLDLQGYQIAAPVQIEAIGDGEFDFVNLPERTRALMQQIASDVVHGRITSTDDALLRIDTPEDPISVEPDRPKINDSRRFSLRPLVTSAFYVLLGLVVFGYVGVLIHANFIKLEVQTAVVARPVEVLAIPVDGRVSVYPVASGSPVAQGDLLAVVIDPALESKIDQQRIELRLAEAEVAKLRQTIQVERARFADYQVINETDARIVSAEIEGLREDQDRTEQHLERIETLAAKGYATTAQIEDARAANALAESRLTSARLMAARKGTLNTAAARRHHNGRAFIVDLDLLAIDLAAAEAERDAAAAHLAILLERRAELALSSPFDGRVVDVLHAENTPLMRGTHVLTVEHAANPVIEAYLNQEEVVQIGLGDRATVFLPSIEQRLPARVLEIDRTSGFVDEQKAQYVWRGPQDRSARVLLKLEADASALPSGLPAIVLFQRRGTDTVRRDLTVSPSPAGDDV